MEILQLRGTVEALRGIGKEARTRPFRMVANTGQPFDRWFGKAIVDLSGVEGIPLRGLPMLLEHDSRKPAGIGLSMELTDEGLVITGDLLLKQDGGKQVSDLSDDGFPLTASLGVKVLAREELEDGVEAEVNGMTVKGPITIWRQSKLSETSFVVSDPADPNTTAEALKGQESPKEGNMPELKDVLDAVPEDWHGHAARLFAAGRSLPEIKEAVLVERLTKAETERDAAIADAKTQREALAAQPAPKTAAPEAKPESDETKLAALRAQSGHPGVDLRRSTAPPEKDLTLLSPVELAKHNWIASDSLRAEFGGSYNGYLKVLESEGAFA